MPLLQRDVARLDFRHLQHFVDQREQMLAAAVDDAEIFLLFHRKVWAARQQMGKPKHGVERRAQFMPHVG